MTDLFSATREHDLPPRWDGRIVQWDPWSDAMPMHMCPPPKERHVCSVCGSTAQPVTTRGLVALSPRATHEKIEGVKRGGMLGTVARYMLYAFRCPGCRHDAVWDVRKDEWWDLDLTDYISGGSSDPRGFW